MTKTGEALRLTQSSRSEVEPAERPHIRTANAFHMGADAGSCFYRLRYDFDLRLIANHKAAGLQGHVPVQIRVPRPSGA